MSTPYGQYEKESLQKSYRLVTEQGFSVYKAALMCSVPEQTLRDRVKGKVPLDAKPGKKTLFTHAEESDLVDHVKYMA